MRISWRNCNKIIAPNAMTRINRIRRVSSATELISDCGEEFLTVNIGSRSLAKDGFVVGNTGSVCLLLVGKGVLEKPVKSVHVIIQK